MDPPTTVLGSISLASNEHVLAEQRVDPDARPEEPLEGRKKRMPAGGHGRATMLNEGWTTCKGAIRTLDRMDAGKMTIRKHLRLGSASATLLHLAGIRLLQGEIRGPGILARMT